MSKFNMKNPNTAGSRVYVGNIKPSPSTRNDLKDKFQVYGTIKGIVVKKGYGFIQFESDSAAQEAIKNENGQKLNGKKLELNLARVQNKPLPSHQNTSRQSFQESGEFRELGSVNDRNLPENDWRDNRTRFDSERYGNESTSRDSFYGRSDPEAYDDPEDYNDFDEMNMNYDSEENSFQKNKSDFQPPPASNQGGGGTEPPFRINKPFTDPSNFGPNDSFSQSGPSFRENPSLTLPTPSRNCDLPIRTIINSSDPTPNDCEIIIVNKELRDYGEYIESRLTKAGLRVDLLLPNEEIPSGRILARLSSRGTLYAIVLHPQNQEHHSLTLNILQGVHEEHRNMPLEDAISFIIRNFEQHREKSLNKPPNSGPLSIVPGPESNFDEAGPKNTKSHPEAIQKLISLLIDNRPLTVLQYDKLLYYLKRRRDEQVRTELGENKELASTVEREAVRKEEELKKRIMDILIKPLPPSTTNTTTTTTTSTSTSSSNPSETVKDLPPSVLPTSSTNSSLGWTADSAATKAAPLLNDPNVQKALDSLIQGDLLRKITSTTNPSQCASPSVPGNSNPIFGTSFKNF